MNFSINMIEVLNMAIDNVNGNFNFFFLKRLLEVIMVKSNLQFYEMDFRGHDAERARDVFTGMPDYGKTPLNSTISKQNDEEDQMQEGNNMELDSEQIDLEQMILKMGTSSKHLNNKIAIDEQILTTTNFGSLNIKMLQDLEKINNETRSNSRQPVTDKSKTLLSKEELINNEISTPTELVNRINKIERVIQKILRKFQKLESDINISFNRSHLKSKHSDLEEIDEQSLSSVMDNKPPVFTGTLDMQQLSNRIDQVESVMRKLSQKTHQFETDTNLINSITQNTIHMDDDDEFEMDTVESKQSLTDQVEKFERVMDINATMFQRIYGKTKINLDNFVTKKHIITNESEILTLQKEKLNMKAYVEFKEKTKTVLRKMKDEIAEYIQKDAEALERVQFVSGGTCNMCEKNVLMKTTHEPTALPKSVFLPRPSIKAHLTYELDRIRKQHNSLPGTKDLNLLNTLCDCVPSARKCFQPNIARKKIEPLKNKSISRPTPLQKWILDKSII